MASITIRRLDESVKSKLRVRAARHQRSMEEEARVILTSAVAERDRNSRKWVDELRAHWLEAGGVELPKINRELPREFPTFEE